MKYELHLIDKRNGKIKKSFECALKSMLVLYVLQNLKSGRAVIMQGDTVLEIYEVKNGFPQRV